MEGEQLAEWQARDMQWTLGFPLCLAINPSSSLLTGTAKWARLSLALAPPPLMLPPPLLPVPLPPSVPLENIPLILSFFLLRPVERWVVRQGVGGQAKGHWL